MPIHDHKIQSGLAALELAKKLSQSSDSVDTKEQALRLSDGKFELVSSKSRYLNKRD